jgi:hypothetical protein
MYKYSEKKKVIKKYYISANIILWSSNI